MTDQKNFQFPHYKALLLALVQELETARWALYEIKTGSETGRILKKIIYLASTDLPIGRPNFTVNTRWLKDHLVDAGFEANLVAETVTRLFGRDGCSGKGTH